MSFLQRIKPRKSAFIPLLFTLTILTSAVIPILNVSVASAAATPYNQRDVWQRLKTYDAYRAIALCFTTYSSSITANHLYIPQGSQNNLSDWKLAGQGTGRNDAFEGVTLVMPAYDDAEYDNNFSSNSVACDVEFFTNYGEALGISDDPAAFLETAGYSFTTASYAQFNGCKVVIGDAREIGTTSNSEQFCLQQASRVMLGLSGTPAMDAQMDYIRYKEILSDKTGTRSNPGSCYADFLNLDTTSTATTNVEGWFAEGGLEDSNGNKVKITLVDSDSNPTKTVTNNITRSEGGTGNDGWKKLIAVNPYISLPNTKNTAEANSITCTAAANKLSSVAGAYVQWAQNPANADLLDLSEAAIESGSSSSDDEGTAGGDNCPIGQGEPMRWLGCSVFFTLSGVTDKLAEQIDNFLYSDPEVLFGEEAQGAIIVFRNMALILVVIAGLIMVISQALGFEFLDAYTVRKTLPRLGVAIVGIALAWPILKLVVGITNDLGGIVYSFLMSIADASGVQGSSTGVGEAISGIILAALATGGALLVLGVGGLLSFLGTIVLALFIGFLVLAIRQVVIFMAVILAPLAIAAYVIPGGEKLWKFWKTTLLTTLFMYPLIMGFIGAGAAMAYMMPKSNDTYSLLAIVIFFAPFFMLPFAFKLAGGLMTTIFSIANDKNKGIFDRLSNYRGNQAKRNTEYMKQGNRFGDTNRFARGFNTLSRGAANTNARNLGYNPARWGQRMRTTMDDQAHDVAGEFSEKSLEFAAIKGDDAKLWASKKRNRAEIESALAERDSGRFAGAANARARADAANQILRAQRETNTSTFEKARVRAQSKTGTGYVDSNGAFNVASMLDDINSAYGDDRTGAERALAEMRGGLVSSGQMAGQAGFGDWAGALSARRSGESEESVQRKVMGGAIDSATPSYALHGKPSGAAAMASEHRARIQDIVKSMKSGDEIIPAGKDAAGNDILRAATAEDLQKALGNIAAISNSAGMYATPANASAYDNNLFGQTIAGADGTQISIKDLMNENSASDSYKTAYSGRLDQMSRELSADTTPPQAGQQ